MMTMATTNTQCRLCGLIFCEDCTPHKDMLPLSWGQKDPQRVCADCHLFCACLATLLQRDVLSCE